MGKIVIINNMTTTSFNKNFVISSEEAFDKIIKTLKKYERKMYKTH